MAPGANGRDFQGGWTELSGQSVGLMGAVGRASRSEGGASREATSMVLTRMSSLSLEVCKKMERKPYSKSRTSVR